MFIHYQIRAMGYAIRDIKSHFPIFTAHPELHYLDSGATSQTPQMVIDAMNDYYTKYRSNTHRGMYNIAVEATEAFENAREIIAKSLNAQTEEIIFTSGATHGLNALAYSLTPRLSHRDNVVITKMEHHANLVPWQQMAKHYGFELRYIDVSPDFRLDMESAKKLIDKNTKIVSFTLASNVLGTVNPAKELIALAKPLRAITIIDAAQGAAHFPINVKDVDCDFLVYSGHKIYGPTGIGVLYGKKIMLEEHMEPFFFGGEMVNEVTLEGATWNDVPTRFEAGTQNIAGVIAMGAAIKFIESVGWNNIIEHEMELTSYLLQRLQETGVQIIGPSSCHFERSEKSLSADSTDRDSLPAPCLRMQEAGSSASGLARNDKLNRIGAVSFILPGIHPHDVAEIMGNENVAIRAGSHCAMPLHQCLNVSATVRASLGMYSTKEDVDALIAAIIKAKKIWTI